MKRPELAPGEEVILETRPCFSSFLSFYLPGFYLLVGGLILFAKKWEVVGYIPDRFEAQWGEVAFYFVLAAAVMGPGLAYSYMKLNWRWAFLALLVVGGAVALKHYVLEQPTRVAVEDRTILSSAELLIVALCGLLSMVSQEMYRRKHLYLVTNARIHTAAGLMGRRQRSLPLSKINDLYVDRGWIGKIIGFGTVIPLTASGLGMGMDFGALAGGVSKKWFGLPTLGVTLAGGHTIQVPKSRTHEALFGIKRPHKVVDRVMRYLASRELKMNAEDL